MSPFPFVIVMDALSRMLGVVVGGGLLSSFSVGGHWNGLTMVFHLLFADVTLLFSGVNSGHLQSLSALLLCFEAVSGWH